ncbi:TetR-like C-terminal domain-containing protein [uncultured Intestinimonas sp.]|uniref:TetR-like C-terminal domain-containing protein n=1 Tax=uncultured Intestinimonas sp. TaxID=1689265 RepID=UPI0025DFDD9B|nr:TetR-like C-terminal domain-containing protein [uncultured Intestinimonas sp.]
MQENDNNNLELLSCESSEIFLRYFKDSLSGLIQSQFVVQNRHANENLPDDFLVNHISGSFVEMVLWWIKGRMKQTPEKLDQHFRAVIEPILACFHKS